MMDDVGQGFEGNEVGGDFRCGWECMQLSSGMDRDVKWGSVEGCGVFLDGAYEAELVEHWGT